jgi:hypothetical protein
MEERYGFLDELEAKFCESIHVCPEMAASLDDIGSLLLAEHQH